MPWVREDAVFFWSQILVAAENVLAQFPLIACLEIYVGKRV
jgi:hypothetical protein